MRAFVSGKVREMRELNVIHDLRQTTTFVKVTVCAEIAPSLRSGFIDVFSLGDDLFADNLHKHFLVRDTANIPIHPVEKTKN